MALDDGTVEEIVNVLKDIAESLERISGQLESDADRRNDRLCSAIEAIADRMPSK